MTEEEFKEFMKIAPSFLKRDIVQFEKGLKENSTLIDCYWGELYGSINSADWDNLITKKEADFLMKKYLL